MYPALLIYSSIKHILAANIYTFIKYYVPFLYISYYELLISYVSPTLFIH